MSHRQSSNSSGGITYPAGNSSQPVTQNVYYSQTSSNIKAFNGHAVEVFADGAVWDTVSGVYLFPGRDYNVVP